MIHVNPITGPQQHLNNKQVPKTARGDQAVDPTSSRWLADAWLDSSCRTQSVWPFCAASCNGARPAPDLSPASTRAPLVSSNRHMAKDPEAAAKCKAVARPSAVQAFTAALYDMRTRATSRWPPKAAIIRGVCPSPSVELTEAPCSKATFTRATSPLRKRSTGRGKPVKENSAAYAHHRPRGYPQSSMT
eukprot:CAMPEP_0204487094 /NCGR_PEP_ID=MMETSP0471-20130131/65937_1 /ASSEMBLY_ACC=CAM_ASM_000602 /TAXON_ID=2969 /ORGANISM="Oxyrrhis marina" /LENGTH=188 /DNA_ID=CAMNT_0051490751 /DNA_START=826 /DNA_END=1390 /DNA_ORIENTATION=+